MRFATFSIVGCFVGTLLIFSLWPDQDRLPLIAHSTAQEALTAAISVQAETVEVRNARTHERLEQTIIDFKYDQTPFSDILDDLRENPGFEIYLNDSSDLKAETPINFALRQVRLSMALELLLLPHNSKYVVRDGIVLIGSVDQMAAMESEIRVYNCRDLVCDHATALDTAVESLTPSDEGETDKVQEPVKSSPKEAQLSQLIRSIVSPQTWEEVGQSVVVYDGLMVVNNSAKVHDQIEELLTQLRKVGMARAWPTVSDERR